MNDASPPPLTTNNLPNYSQYLPSFFLFSSLFFSFLFLPLPAATKEERLRIPAPPTADSSPTPPSTNSRSPGGSSSDHHEDYTCPSPNLKRAADEESSEFLSTRKPKRVFSRAAEKTVGEKLCAAIGGELSAERRDGQVTTISWLLLLWSPPLIHFFLFDIPTVHHLVPKKALRHRGTPVLL